MLLSFAGRAVFRGRAAREFWSVVSLFDRLREQLEKPAPEHIRGQLSINDESAYGELTPERRRALTRQEKIRRIVADKLRQKAKEGS